MGMFDDFMSEGTAKEPIAAKPKLAEKTAVKSSAGMFDDFLAEQPKATGNLATDIPKAVGRGLARLPDVVGSAIQTAGSGYAKMADVALGNENAGQGGAIENAVNSGVGMARDATTRPMANYVDENLPYSQGTQEAQNTLNTDIAKIGSDNSKNAVQKGLASLGAAVVNPRGSLPSVLESIPQFVAGAAALKAAKVAEGLSGLGKVSELTKGAELATGLGQAEKAAELAKLASRAGAVQDTAIAGIGNAALEGEGAARGTRDDIMNMPTETLMQNPQFAQLKDKLTSELGNEDDAIAEARRITSETAASNAYTPAAVLGATASALTGGGLEGALMRGFKGTAEKGIVKATIGGGKEMLEEGMQGASGQMAQNFAEQPYTGVDLMSGVPEQVGMGAGMGLFSGGAGRAAGAAYNKTTQKPVVTPEAQAAIDAHAQAQTQADTLAQQAANTGGLSGAALSGQAATAQADADTHLATAQGLQDGTIAPVQPEPVAETPSVLPKITPDVHAHISNVLDSAYQDFINPKKGEKSLNKGAIQSAANDLGVSYDPQKERVEDILIKAKKALQNYNIANIDPVAIEHAQATISAINEKTAQGLPPTNVDNYNLSVAAEKLGTKPDLNSVQSTIDLHTQLNAKPAPEDATSPKRTNSSANGGTEQTVQPSAKTGGSNKEQPAPTGQTNSIEHDESGFIKSGKDKLTFQHQGSGGLDATVQADNFIRDKNLADTHTIVNDGYGNIHIQRKPNAIQENKGSVQAYKQAKEESKTANYHPAIEKLASDIEIGGGIVTDKDGRRSTSVNPDWFKNGVFKPINPLTNKPYSKMNVLDVKDAVDARKAGKIAKGMDAVKQHAILKALSSIASDMAAENDSEFTDYTSESESSTESKSAYYRVTAGQKIEEANSDYIDEVYKWAELELKKPNSEEKDDAQAVIEEINQYRNNAADTQPNTAQPKSPRASEDTADTGNDGAQAKQTVSNDTINQPTNKAQNGEGTDTTTQTTTEKVDDNPNKAVQEYASEIPTSDKAEESKDAENNVTQTRETTAEIKQKTVSPDSVEQDGWDKKLSLYIDANRSNDGSSRRTAKVAKAGVTGRDIQSNKQRVDLPTFSEQENIASLNFDQQKLKDAEHILENVADAALLRRQAMLDEIALTQELELLAETDNRIKIENNKNGSVKYTVFDDDGKKVSSFTRSPDKDNLDREAIVERDKLRQQLVDIGAGKFEVKNLTLHVQPLDATSVNEMRDMAIAKAKVGTIQQKAKEAADAHKAVLFLDKVIHNLKAVLYALFKAINASTANKSMDNDNVKEYKFRNADNTVMFTLQKGKSEFVLSSNNSDIKGANAREKLKNIALRERIKADIDRIEKESARRQMQGKIEAATSSANKAVVIDGAVQGMLGIDNKLLQALFQEQKANGFTNNFKGFEASQVSWQLPTVSGQQNPDLDVYQSVQAKKAQESRWISQQAEQGKPEADAGVTPEVKPNKPSGDVKQSADKYDETYMEDVVPNSKEAIDIAKDLFKSSGIEQGDFNLSIEEVNYLEDILGGMPLGGKNGGIGGYDITRLMSFLDIPKSIKNKLIKDNKFFKNLTAVSEKISELVGNKDKKANEDKLIAQAKKVTLEQDEDIFSAYRLYSFALDELKDKLEEIKAFPHARFTTTVARSHIAKEKKRVLDLMKFYTPSKPTPADKPVNQTNGTDKTDKASADEKMDELKARMGQALSELNSLLGGKMNLTEEEETKLLPIMSKIFRIAAEMGYLKFKEAAGFVIKQIGFSFRFR